MQLLIRLAACPPLAPKTKILGLRCNFRFVLLPVLHLHRRPVVQIFIRVSYCSNLRLTIYLDDYLKLVQEAQEILGKIKVYETEDVPDSDGKICILKDHAWNKAYVKARIATSALFTYLSPKTRQPLTFNCNARRTMKSAVTNKTAIYPTPYADNLKATDKQDGVSISSGRQTYYLVSSLVHQPDFDSKEKAKNEPPMDDFTHLRSMTHLDFGENVGTAESLVLSDFGI